MKVDVIVTRHPGLIEYLKEIGMADENTVVLGHASVADIRGLHVVGVLPHSLSCECAYFTEVPLNLPPELRGVELGLEQVRQYAGRPVTYLVRKVRS